MAQAAREIEGTTLPPVGTYELDASHSEVAFVARHLFTKVRGRFTDFSGTVTVGETPEDSAVDVTIQTASVQTNDERRDQHLHSGDFFLVEEYPTITFTSTAVRHSEGNEFEMTGDLTVRGVTKPVTLQGEFLGWTAKDPFGRTVLSATASVTVDRSDWGLNWNQALETGGVLVAKKVDLVVEVEASLQA
jgi:polyisoprenoid-binding protein YceI